MKRPLRYAIDSAALVSAATCLILAVLLIDCPIVDQVKKHAAGQVIGSLHAGIFGMSVSFYNQQQPYRGGIISVSGFPGPSSRFPVVKGFYLAGIYYRHILWRDGHTYWTLTIPMLYLMVGTLVLPLVRLRSRVRAGQRIHGTCASCGYDLRATANRCPECGLVPKRVSC